MDTLAFIANIVKSCAWPAAYLFTILALRRPLVELIKYLTKIKYGDIELEFSEQISAISTGSRQLHAKPGLVGGFQPIKERLLSYVSSSPGLAIIEAWKVVEQAIFELAHKHKMDVAHGVWSRPVVMSSMMLGKNVLTDAQYELILKLNHLKKTVIQNREFAVNMAEAAAYIDSALLLKASLESESFGC